MGKTRRDREEAAQRLIPRATTVLGLARRTARVPEGRFAWWQHAPATWDPILPRAEVTRTRRRRMLRQTSLGSTRRRYAGDKLRWGYFGPPSTIGLSSETKVGARAGPRATSRGAEASAPDVWGLVCSPLGPAGQESPANPKEGPQHPGLALWTFGGLLLALGRRIQSPPSPARGENPPGQATGVLDFAGKKFPPKTPKKGFGEETRRYFYW